MMSSQSKKMAAAEIPPELLIEILKRLPAKSMARFKCVSKLWFSLIHSQGHLLPSPPRLYLTSGDYDYDCSIMEEVCPVPAESELFPFSFTSGNGKNSAVFDLVLTKEGNGGEDMVVLRGLILNTVYGHDKQAFIYNPITGQRVDLPAIKFKFKMSKKKYFLGYDPVLDQYKVVCSAVVTSVNHKRIYAQHWWVFVLEAESSWKTIEFDHPHHPGRQRLCINGVIYYLANRSKSGGFVMSFNVRSEKFSIIQPPSVMYDYWMCMNLDLIEYGGKPTILDYRHLQDPSGLLELWVLEDAEKWSKKSVVLQPCLRHYFPTSFLFHVIGTTQNGEVIFKPYDLSSPMICILYYDLHKNDVRRVDIRGIPEEPDEFAMMDTGVNIMHLKI